MTWETQLVEMCSAVQQSLLYVYSFNLGFGKNKKFWCWCVWVGAYCYRRRVWIFTNGCTVLHFSPLKPGSWLKQWYFLTLNFFSPSTNPNTHHSAFHSSVNFSPSFLQVYVFTGPMGSVTLGCCGVLRLWSCTWTADRSAPRTALTHTGHKLTCGRSSPNSEGEEPCGWGRSDLYVDASVNLIVLQMNGILSLQKFWNLPESDGILT